MGAEHGGDDSSNTEIRSTSVANLQQRRSTGSCSTGTSCPALGDLSIVSLGRRYTADLRHRSSNRPAMQRPGGRRAVAPDRANRRLEDRAAGRQSLPRAAQVVGGVGASASLPNPSSVGVAGRATNWSEAVGYRCMGRRRSACSRQPAAGARKTSGRAWTACGSTRPSSACPSPRPRRASSLRPRRWRKSSRNSRDPGGLHGLERGIIQACCDPASSCNGTTRGAAPGSTTCGYTTSTAPSPAARRCSARASRPSSECPATSGHTSGGTTAISLATWCFGAAVGVAADIVGETLTVGTCGPACRPPDPGRNAPAPGVAKKSEKGSQHSLARTSHCAKMVRSCHLCRLGGNRSVVGFQSKALVPSRVIR